MVLRERLIPAFPPGGRIGMPLLAGLLGASSVHLEIAGVGVVDPFELEDGCHVALRSGGNRAVAALEPGLDRRLVDLGIGRPDTVAGGALTSGEEGVLLHVLDRAGGDWIRAGGHDFFLKGILDGPRQAATYLGGGRLAKVAGTLSIDGRGFGVSLLVPAAGDTAPPFEGAPDLLRAAGWPVRYGIVVGRSSLLVADADGLGPGDVVTLDSWSHPEWRGADRCSIECGDDALEARWLDHDRLELVLSNLESEKMETGDTERRVELRETRDGATRAMEIEVRVVAGEMEMSVEEALALVPGRVLVLDRPVGSSVSLVAGGRTVARGELVAHEGRMAVEITEVP